VDVIHPQDKERGITQEEFRLIKIHMSCRQYFYPLLVPYYTNRWNCIYSWYQSFFPLEKPVGMALVCYVVPYKHQLLKVNKFNSDSVSFKVMYLKWFMVLLDSQHQGTSTIALPLICLCARGSTTIFDNYKIKHKKKFCIVCAVVSCLKALQ
jgi:hypothetical protein